MSYTDGPYTDGPYVPYGQQALGRCSLCGGVVTVPNIWHGIIPPIPQCTSCGAYKRASHWTDNLPVIPMERVISKINTGVSTESGTATSGSSLTINSEGEN